MVIHGDTMGSLLEIHGGFTHIKPRFLWGYEDIYIILYLYPYRILGGPILRDMFFLMGLPDWWTHLMG